MHVTFLGTGTSTGVPVIGCDCEVCHSSDRRDRRWRPSVQIKLEDGLSVLIDASPDLRAQALEFSLDRVDCILLTHSHADHVLGLDDVRIYNFRQGAEITCYGNSRTLTDVRRMFSYVFDPKTPQGGGLPQLSLCPVNGPFSLNGSRVVPVPLRHGALPIFGYRIGAFAYLTDCNEIPEASWPLLGDLDVLVLDALRRRPHSTHFNIDQAVQAAQKIRAKNTYFTHMTHDVSHAETCSLLPSGISLAYDGLVLKINEQLNETVHEASIKLFPLSDW